MPLSRSPSARQRIAEIVLRHGPVERHALARPFLQRVAIGRDRLLQPRRAALALAERRQRIAEIVLRHGPVERHALARHQIEQRPSTLDRRKQRVVVAELIALTIERVSLFLQVIDPLVLVSAFRRKRRRGIREVLSCFAVPQASEGDVAAPRGGLGRVDGEAVEHAPLLGLDVRQQGVRLGEIARFNRLLRLGFQGSDLGVVARLRQRRRLQRLEALGNLDELGGQPLGRDILLAQNVQRGADLTLVEVEFGLQFGDQLLLCFGKLRVLSNEGLRVARAECR